MERKAAMMAKPKKISAESTKRQKVFNKLFLENIIILLHSDMMKERLENLPVHVVKVKLTDKVKPQIKSRLLS